MHDDISTLGEGKFVIIQATCVGNIIGLLLCRYMPYREVENCHQGTATLATSYNSHMYVF